MVDPERPAGTARQWQLANGQATVDWMGGAEDIFDESVLFSLPVFQVRAYRRSA
jgi:hypothetical protein